MFCTKCGKEIAENLNFCTYCGAETNSANKPRTEITTSPSVGLKSLEKKAGVSTAGRVMAFLGPIV